MVLPCISHSHEMGTTIALSHLVPLSEFHLDLGLSWTDIEQNYNYNYTYTYTDNSTKIVNEKEVIISGQNAMAAMHHDSLAAVVRQADALLQSQRISAELECRRMADSQHQMDKLVEAIGGLTHTVCVQALGLTPGTARPSKSMPGRICDWDDLSMFQSRPRSKTPKKV